MSSIFPFFISLVVFIIPVATLLVLVYRFRSNRGYPSLKHSLQHLKISLTLLGIGIGIAAVIARMLTADLNSFGYPDVPADVQTAEQILDYLQRYNRSIVTNTYALLWFFYAFAVWFLTTLYAFARAVVKAILAHSH